MMDPMTFLKGFIAGNLFMVVAIIFLFYAITQRIDFLRRYYEKMLKQNGGAR